MVCVLCKRSCWSTLQEEGKPHHIPSNRQWPNDTLQLLWEERKFVVRETEVKRALLYDTRELITVRANNQTSVRHVFCTYVITSDDARNAFGMRWFGRLGPVL